MGCNAWNHSTNCTCGWGGDGHAGSNYGGGGLFTRFGLHGWSVPNSCTNPNATCPVCGASVYFYQNSSGSKVYFDDLGPPWPKHGCTDSVRQPIRRNKDWVGGIITKVVQYGQSPARSVFVRTPTGDKEFFVNDRVGHYVETLPTFITQRDGLFKLSSLVPKPSGLVIVEVRVFKRAMEAGLYTKQPSVFQVGPPYASGITPATKSVNPSLPMDAPAARESAKKISLEIEKLAKQFGADPFSFLAQVRRSLSSRVGHRLPAEKPKQR